MSEAISFSALQAGLPFGSRVGGVTRASLEDEASRARIWREFEDRGLLVFEGVEQTSEMQLALSSVFGPLKDHPVAEVERAEEDLAAGIIDLHSGPDHDPTILAGLLVAPLHDDGREDANGLLPPPNMTTQLRPCLVACDIRRVGALHANQECVAEAVAVESRTGLDPLLEPVFTHELPHGLAELLPGIVTASLSLHRS